MTRSHMNHAARPNRRRTTAPRPPKNISSTGYYTKQGEPIEVFDNLKVSDVIYKLRAGKLVRCMITTLQPLRVQFD